MNRQVVAPNAGKIQLQSARAVCPCYESVIDDSCPAFHAILEVPGERRAPASGPGGRKHVGPDILALWAARLSY